MSVRTPKVALLVETSRGYGRALLGGIARYARHHGPWHFYISPGDFAQTLPLMNQWDGDGIIARLETPSMAKQVCASGLPTIVLDASQNIRFDIAELESLSEVASDSAAASRLAAEHLVELGHTRFAFVGEHGRLWSQMRETAFRESLAAHGHDPFVYEVPKSRRNRLWENELAILADWLKALPKPVGIMACNDDRGRQVLDACHAAGVRVPLDASVIGVDNDELLCDLANPPLSSVALNADAAGYRVAELLDDLMHQRRTDPARVVVEPIGVIQRRSTQAITDFDPDVAAALHFIHDHAAHDISVDDVARHVRMSRRTLELRMREVANCSPYQELQRVRFERARRLLIETDLPITRVATAAGFSSNAYLTQVFQNRVGMAPSRFRRKHRY